MGLGSFFKKLFGKGDETAVATPATPPAAPTEAPAQPATPPASATPTPPTTGTV